MSNTSAQVNIRMSNILRDELDEFRRNSGFTTRSQTIVYLLQAGLKSKKNIKVPTYHNEKVVVVPVRINNILSDKIDDYMESIDEPVKNKSKIYTMLIVNGLEANAI